MVVIERRPTVGIAPSEQEDAQFWNWVLQEGERAHNNAPHILLRGAKVIVGLIAFHFFILDGSFIGLVIAFVSYVIVYASLIGHGDEYSRLRALSRDERHRLIGFAREDGDLTQQRATDLFEDGTITIILNGIDSDRAALRLERRRL